MMWELLLSMIFREAKINKERRKERLRGLEEWGNQKTRDSTGENSTISIPLEMENPDHCISGV